MLLKRVGIPALVALIAVLLTAAAYWLPFGAALAAPDGSVTLSAPIQIPVALRGIAPGDSGTAEALRIRYTGSVPAWIGLDSDLLGPLASGEHPLTVTLASGGMQFTARGEKQVLGLFAPGDVVSLFVTYAFPSVAGNTYQAADANLILQLHAVQAEENTRFELGRATGPIAWGGLVASNGVQPSQAAPSQPSAAQAGSQPGQPSQAGGQETFPDPPRVTPEVLIPQGSAACCACLGPLLWIGLLYMLLLVLAMLAAFYLGWRLRCRRRRRRIRLRRAPILTPPDKS